MTTFKEIEIISRHKSDYEDQLFKIKQYQHLASGNFYFNGYQGRGIPSELIAEIKSTLIKFYEQKASSHLTALENLNINVDKPRKELEVLVKDYI